MREVVKAFAIGTAVYIASLIICFGIGVGVDGFPESPPKLHHYVSWLIIWLGYVAGTWFIRRFQKNS